MTAPWPVSRRLGTAQELHALDFGAPAEAEVWVLETVRDALVLGSAQAGGPTPAGERDAGAPGGGIGTGSVDLGSGNSDIVRRRSGGGAVWLEAAPKGGSVWIDVLVPRDHPLWHDDIGVAPLWLGDVWAAALAGTIEAPTVHRGAMVRSRWSDQFCFAGLGPGEVTAGPGGPKVVGISQRRTRAGARFQCVAYRAFDAGPAAALLGIPPADLDGCGLGTGQAPAAVIAAFLAELRTHRP